MRIAEERALLEIGVMPYKLKDSTVQALKSIFTREADLRQDVRNKELKVVLAEAVEKETGNDQNLEDLKRQLRLSRKVYADHLSDLDYSKNYSTLVPRDYKGNILGSSEEARLAVEDERLRPIEEKSEYEKLIEHIPKDAGIRMQADGDYTKISAFYRDGTEEYLGKIKRNT